MAWTDSSQSESETGRQADRQQPPCRVGFPQLLPGPVWACGSQRPQAAGSMQGPAKEAIPMVISQSTSLRFVSWLPTQDLRVCVCEKVEGSIPSVFCEPEISMCVGMYGLTSQHSSHHWPLWSGGTGGAMRMPSALTHHLVGGTPAGSTMCRPLRLTLSPPFPISPSLPLGEWCPLMLSI